MEQLGVMTKQVRVLSPFYMEINYHLRYEL